MKPMRRPGLEIRTVGTEVLVHDPDRGKVHVLNASGGKVIELCDGTRTVAEVAVYLAGVYSIDIGRAQSDVKRVLGEFEALGIVELALQAPAVEEIDELLERAQVRKAAEEDRSA